jgi:glutathione-independent formaldehyde dehydrogenase
LGDGFQAEALGLGQQGDGGEQAEDPDAGDECAGVGQPDGWEQRGQRVSADERPDLPRCCGYAVAGGPYPDREDLDAGWTSFCLRTNPTEGVDGAAYGYAQMAPTRAATPSTCGYRSPIFNLLPLPPGSDFERDFTMLSDIFPTGYHGAALAGVSPGDTVAVYGAGPVGLLAAHSSYLRGAARVLVVDMQADRLALAERFGATPIDIAGGDPAGQIMDATGGAGANRGIEAVGYQAHDPAGDEHSEMVLDSMVGAVRTTGGIGVVGVYVPSDPKAASEGTQEGRIGFDHGTFFQKGQRMGTGQCPVKRYNEQLRDLIIAGQATPSLLVSHELSLDEAPATRSSTSGRTDTPRCSCTRRPSEGWPAS